jgi:hypothetical protein
MSKGMIVVFIVASFGSLASPQSTSDWQTLTDPRANGPFCQGKSPQGWDTWGGGGSKKAKGIARVVAQGEDARYTFDRVKSRAPKAIQVFEDSP